MSESELRAELEGDDERANFISLIELIKDLQKRVAKLESSRENFQNRISEMVVGYKDDSPITPREIAQLLFDWINTDE